MKKILSIFAALIALSACHDIDEWDNDARGNFDALWNILDAHYCFFDEKGIDWDDVYRRYSAKVSPTMTSEELFLVCSDMLDELKDGHVNLSSAFNTSYYRKWWSDYPHNFDLRTIEDNYLHYNYRSMNACTFDMLTENVGYLRISTFSSPIGDGNLDNILNYLSSAKGLIIDVRDNGGGDVTVVETFCRRFIFSHTLVGYISHKTGPGHSDFSKPMEIYYDPAPAGRLMWSKPVVVLTNRGSYSATNTFVSVMKSFPQVTIMGDCTGGGSGMPYSSELPNGWGVRFSACPMLDAKGVCTENGIMPSEGFKIDISEADRAAHRDTILDTAINFLTGK
ncbi:MAG: S41 family peptidase [Muribaculaceae bacterium]|nr:S41 family peptidase [Muribaculaceae bacterium]MBR5744571.1 S41 family peptidase [Muribaculaceae bacterium]